MKARFAAPLLATLLVACPASEENLRKGNVMFSNGQLDEAEAFYQQICKNLSLIIQKIN